VTDCKTWPRSKVRLSRKKKNKKALLRQILTNEFYVAGAIIWRGETFLQVKDEDGNILPVLFNAKLLEIIPKP